MPANAHRPRADQLEEAKRQFQQWRKGRARPGRIPFRLWTLAAEAASTHGIQRTAQRLQVDAESLKQWMQRRGGADSIDRPAAPEFIELPPLPMPTLAECHLEVEEPNGRKLRLCLKGAAVAQAAAVLPAIWRAPQS